MMISNTPYDDVFRTLLNDCSFLIIPVINEVFGEHYVGNEEIVFAPNEHFLNREGGQEQGRITDTSFKIIGTETKKYHWECQSSPDESMLVRFFEYDTQIALDEGEIRGNILTVTLPHSAALFLRCKQTTPDKMGIRIVTPGGSVGYEIPIMKLQRYTIEEIFEKELLFLIPFYIFLHESRFKEYNENTVKRESLLQEYEKIKNHLEELLNTGKITEYTKCTITDMSNKVVEHIAEKYKNVREGVKSVMGGRVLEYEAKAIRNEGIKEGIKEGFQRGRLEMLFDLVRENLLTIKDAASQAKLTEETFKEKMMDSGR
ncbi:MAG: hypothetical protein NC419_06070 [Muribaculaceae bacterium]|nr:hypothetical protein [Muribaculaceae bacterium]